MRSLILSLDLDGPWEYARLHGLDLDDVDATMMYRAPLDRFVALCQSLGGTGTLFCIGRDLDGAAGERLRQLHDDGFEVASHSFVHDYRLSRRDPAAVTDDVARGCEAIAKAIGTAPVGFRAPGYHLSPALLDALEAAGLSYDSSVMPSPPYYAAKALVLAAYRLMRRRSAALLGSPRLAAAPRRPYRPGTNPYERGCRRLVELPIAVAGLAGWPVTGASLALAPAWLRRRMIDALAAQETLVINLHAMDLVDPMADGLPAELRTRQPELDVPVAERGVVLRGALAPLASTRRVITCRQLAAEVEGDV